MYNQNNNKKYFFHSTPGWSSAPKPKHHFNVLHKNDPKQTKTHSSCFNLCVVFFLHIYIVATFFLNPIHPHPLLPLHLAMHNNLHRNLERWPAAACLSHQTCIRNRCIFDVRLFMSSHVHERVNECISVCVFYVSYAECFQPLRVQARPGRCSCMPRHTGGGGGQP